MDVNTNTTSPATTGQASGQARAAFRIHAIPAEVLDAVRTGDHSTAETPAQRVTAEGGEPVRCCLRNARAGEEMVLFSYEPPLPPSPYREIGAVYVHAHASECDGSDDLSRYPTDWIGRPQVLRAYDERGWIHPATTTHDGSDPAKSIADVLAQPGVVQVHSRNIAYGCYMFTVTAQ